MNLTLIIVITVVIILLSYVLFRKKINEYFNEINKHLPYRAVIVGCARDIAVHLPTTKIKLSLIKNLFKESKIIIYENDSSDDTLNILKNWESENFIQLITEKNVKGQRTERLAHGRNTLYNEAMKNDFDFLIVIDLDNVIQGLTEDSILSCFSIDEKWAMLGGNQTIEYYDYWALRTYDDWMPFDCWYCVREQGKSLSYCLDSRRKHIDKDNKPIKVKSCFGGIAIYKREYLNNCSYGNGIYPGTGNVETCEHVKFNECVLNNGGDIYINPKMINH